jgi:hypothetical protein
MNDLPTGLPVQICNRRKTIMRTTVNISFPDDLYLFIRDRVDAGAYASVSEYMRALSAKIAPAAAIRSRGGQKPGRSVERMRSWPNTVPDERNIEPADTAVKTLSGGFPVVKIHRPVVQKHEPMKIARQRASLMRLSRSFNKGRRSNQSCWSSHPLRRQASGKSFRKRKLKQ